MQKEDELLRKEDEQMRKEDERLRNLDERFAELDARLNAILSSSSISSNPQPPRTTGQRRDRPSG